VELRLKAASCQLPVASFLVPAPLDVATVDVQWQVRSPSASMGRGPTRTLADSLSFGVRINRIGGAWAASRQPPAFSCPRHWTWSPRIRSDRSVPRLPRCDEVTRPGWQLAAGRWKPEPAGPTRTLADSLSLGVRITRTSGAWAASRQPSRASPAGAGHRETAVAGPFPASLDATRQRDRAGRWQLVAGSPNQQDQRRLSQTPCHSESASPDPVALGPPAAILLAPRPQEQAAENPQWQVRSPSASMRRGDATGLAAGSWTLEARTSRTNDDSRRRPVTRSPHQPDRWRLGRQPPAASRQPSRACALGRGHRESAVAGPLPVSLDATR